MVLYKKHNFFPIFLKEIPHHQKHVCLLSGSLNCKESCVYSPSRSILKFWTFIWKVFDCSYDWICSCSNFANTFSSKSTWLYMRMHFQGSFLLQCSDLGLIIIGTPLRYPRGSWSGGCFSFRGQDIPNKVPSWASNTDLLPCTVWEGVFLLPS